MNYIVTWMYSSPAGENIKHNQIGSSVSSLTAQNYYWRCVFVLFESSFRMNGPDTRHVLFVNKRPPDVIDGIDTTELVRRYNIEIVEFTNLTLSPSDYFGAWNTQFLVLDVLDWFADRLTVEDSLLILDSDIVFNKPLPPDFSSNLRKERALLYSMDLPGVQNGLTREEMLEISKELNPDFPAQHFIYAGGEFVCLNGAEVAPVAAAARAAFEECLVRHKAGKKKFNEEAHLLSYVYHVRGYASFTANAIVKRIWTDRSVFSNVDGTESELIFWHLPAEKKRGFIQAFRLLNAGIEKLSSRSRDQMFRIKESGLERLLRPMRRLARPIYHAAKRVM